MVLCIFACILGFLFLLYRIHDKSAESEAVLNALASEARTGVPVEVMEVVPSDWESWKSYYGRAQAVRTQEVTPFAGIRGEVNPLGEPSQ